MIRNCLLFPMGMASAALTAFKTNQYKNKFKKMYVTVPLTMITLAKSQNVFMRQTNIVKNIQNTKSKGITKFISYFIRFVQLGLIFLPSILLLPLAIFKSTRHIWMNCFVWSISKAGVVWIKVFQHMSHRGDVIGEDLAENF